MSETNSSKKWLKEASMRRLSLYIKNKTEQVGNAMIFDTTMSLPEEDIEKSGLSSSEIYHLQRWVAGNFISLSFVTNNNSCIFLFIYI